MKAMTCRELGGPCDEKLVAETWNDMVRAMTEHVLQNHPDTAKAARPTPPPYLRAARFLDFLAGRALVRELPFFLAVFLAAGRADFLRARAFLAAGRAAGRLAFFREALFFFAAGLFSERASPLMASLIVSRTRRTTSVTGLSWLSSQPASGLSCFIAASGLYAATTMQ